MYEHKECVVIEWIQIGKDIENFLLKLARIDKLFGNN